MRIPRNNSSSSLKSPSTPRSFASPSADGASKNSSAWREKLKLRKKLLAKSFTRGLPMEDDGEESTTTATYYNDYSSRSFFRDFDSEEVDSLWGSRASIEFIPDEDDIARSIYSRNPSTFVEDDDTDGDTKQSSSAPTVDVTSPIVTSPLTQSKRGGMRKHMKKQLSGYNFAALLLEEEV